MIQEIRNLIMNYTILCKNPVGNTMHLYNIEEFIQNKIKEEFDSKFWEDYGNKVILTYFGCTIIFDSEKKVIKTIGDLDDTVSD